MKASKKTLMTETLNFYQTTFKVVYIQHIINNKQLYQAEIYQGREEVYLLESTPIYESFKKVNDYARETIKAELFLIKLAKL